MGYVEKRYGNYRARYRDPNGRARSETFTRKMDAERFLREVQVEVERGRWLDPRGANVTLTEWSEEYLRLARRLAKTTQDTCRRDITKYVLPRFGDYRIGRIPADEVENWLNDEIDAGIAPKEPKANSIRSITISEFTASVLAAHLDGFAQEGRTGLVFPNGASHPIASSSYWNNHFTPALRKAGLSCRFHDLRHTSVALAIEAGAHPKAIQTRMGHSSINVTLDRYGHLFPELDEAIATSFGQRLTEAQARRDIRPAPNILAAS